jgi:hypothetical protein
VTVKGGNLALVTAVIGAPGSILRFTWGVALMGLMLVGVWKLMHAIAWLTDGNPSAQFTRLSDPLGQTKASN